MRVVQFLQVVVLLFLIGYAVLVYLENPVLLRLPLLFAGRELVLPAGLGLGLGVLVGALYGALLILPRYLRQRLLRRGDLTRRRGAEATLQATLQAVIDGDGLSESRVDDTQEPLLPVSERPASQMTAAQTTASQTALSQLPMLERLTAEPPEAAPEEGVTARAVSARLTGSELTGSELISTELINTDGLQVRA